MVRRHPMAGIPDISQLRESGKGCMDHDMYCEVPGLVLDAFVYAKRSPMRTYAKRTTGWESVLGDENDFPVKGIRRFFKWMSDIHSDPIAWLQSQYDHLIS